MMPLQMMELEEVQMSEFASGSYGKRLVELNDYE